MQIIIPARFDQLGEHVFATGVGFIQ